MRELLVRLHIERLPEGVYLATSDDLPGLVAQGRTLDEVMEIARDVARKLIESFNEYEDGPDRAMPCFTGELDILTPVAVP